MNTYIPKDPQFCIITPTQYLEQFASRSSMHLVLAHLVDTDQQYADFYANRSEFKIMDNGAFELGESYDPDKLIELGNKCNADAIVLPDYPFCHSSKTIEAATQMMHAVKDAGFKTMFVPQSELNDKADWISSYEWAASNQHIDIIGMSILGIPNAIPHIPAAYARVVMTETLIDRNTFNFSKHHHYLGLNAGPNLELPALIKQGAMDSCDSSNPVWAGICGQSYNKMTDSFLPTRKISKHVDFNYPMTSDPHVLEAIDNNISMTLDMINSCKREVSPPYIAALQSSSWKDVIPLDQHKLFSICEQVYTKEATDRFYEANITASEKEKRRIVLLQKRDEFLHLYASTLR